MTTLPCLINTIKNKAENQQLQATIQDLKRNLEKANMEKAAVLDIGENMEKQVQEKVEQTKKMEESYKTKLKEMQDKMEDMEKENQHLFDKLVTHAKDRADKILDKGTLKKTNNEEIQNKVDTFKLLNVGSAKRNEQIGQTNIRSMTLKQLKDTINEIYESKEKHDEK